jgi:hypothetical protein
MLMYRLRTKLDCGSNEAKTSAERTSDILEQPRTLSEPVRKECEFCSASHNAQPYLSRQA